MTISAVRNGRLKRVLGTNSSINHRCRSNIHTRHTGHARHARHARLKKIKLRAVKPKRSALSSMENAKGYSNEASDVGLDVIVIVGMACTAAALSDMSKVCMSVATITISTDLNWTNSVVGQIQSSLFFGFLLTQLPGGALSKTYSGREILKYAVILWSLGQLLTPFAALVGVVPLCLTRGVVGLGMGLAPTALTDILARTVPPSFRARAAGSVFSGFNAGSALAYLLTPSIMSYFGWESVFYITGVLGLLWCTVWYNLGETEDLQLGSELAVSKKEEGKKIIAQEASAKGLASTSKIPWTSFFSSAAVWAVIGGHFSDNWGKFGLTTWLPTFLHSNYGMSAEQSALWTVTPLVLGIGVAAYASPTADKLIANGWSVTTVRKLMMGIALFCPALFLSLSSMTHNPVSVIIFITLAMAVSRFAVSSLYCIHQDMSPQYASTLLGITNTFGALAGVLSAYTTGALEDISGSWFYSFFLPAIIVYIAGGFVWVCFADARGQNFTVKK